MIYYFASMFALGTIFGSFFYTLAMRLSDPVGQNARSILMTPSNCDSCHDRVPWYGLIPLAGYCLLGGRCRKCRTKVSTAYPVAEIVYGALAVAIFWRTGLALYGLPLYLALSCAICIAIVDIKVMRIPHSLLIGMLLFTIFAIALTPDFQIMDHVYGLIFLGGVFLVIGLLFPGGFGGGDFKLAMVMGLLLGLAPSIVAFELAVVSGAIVGAGYALQVRYRRGLALPFAPFLVFGLIMAVLFASELLLVYDSLSR